MKRKSCINEERGLSCIAGVGVGHCVQSRKGSSSDYDQSSLNDIVLIPTLAVPSP